MNWRTAHQRAMVAAFTAQEELGLETCGRVDVFEALDLDGLRLTFRPLATSAALYVPARTHSPPGVIVKAGHPLALQRFSAAHEYGHHVFGHGEQVDQEGEPHGRRARLPAHEQLAEAFAAWFLMPPEAAASAMERLGRAQPGSAIDAYALALRLGTSFKATCVHLPSLKLADARAADGWRDRPLKSLKQELSADPPPGGWHNDVWVLGELDAAATLVVRAGDLLLIDLPGWEIAEVPRGAKTFPSHPVDLLSAPYSAVGLSPEMAAGPARIVLRDRSSTLNLSLMVERPRLGRYVGGRRAPV